MRVETKQRAILLGDSRTGSHLLARSLEQHPDLRCTDEVFETWGERQAMPFTRRSFAQLFADHSLVMVQRHQAEAAPELLGRCCDRIISLSRDLLSQYRSWRTAMATGHWRCDHPLPRQPEQIEVRFSQPEYVMWCRAMNANRRRMQYSRPTLVVRYSMLRDDWAETIERVQRFLGVEPLPLDPAITKTPEFPVRYVGWPADL